MSLEKKLFIKIIFKYSPRFGGGTHKERKALKYIIIQQIDKIN